MQTYFTSHSRQYTTCSRNGTAAPQAAAGEVVLVVLLIVLIVVILVVAEILVPVILVGK